MAKKNQEEKKDNPLLTSLLACFCGTVLFTISKTHDLEVALIFTLPGNIVFPVLGAVLYLISIFKLKEWFDLRKKHKENKDQK